MSDRSPVAVRRQGQSAKAGEGKSSSRDNGARALIESFDAMALGGGSRRRYSDPRAGPQFIGGFKDTGSKPLPNTPRPGFPGYPNVMPSPHERPPSYTSQNAPSFPGGLPPLPIPPNAPSIPMPEPQYQSLTMQYALDSSTSSPSPRMSPEYRPDTKYKPPPDTTGHLTPPIPPHVTRPHSDPTLPPDAHAQPSGQRKDQQPPRIKPVVPPGRHLRAHSTPPSPITPANDSSSNAEAVQCSGMTKAGKQCTRQVKVDASMRNVGSGVDVFCFQHAKEVLAPSGFYDRKSGQNFIKFADWIPDYLQPATQASLRAEMEKARSHTDEPGYIYTFEILDPDETEVIHLKVGRANNLNRRMDQWGKQCGSKEQIVRGWWPGGIVHDEASLMKGTIKAGEKGAWCHRLERLVHLELADLATNTPYLHAGFPGKGKAKATASGSGSTSGNGDGKDKDKGKKGKKDINRCPDCGTAHKEIFSFVRAKKGTYKDKEWDLIVKPVIEKWGAFVEAYL